MKIKILYDIGKPINRAIEVPNGTPFNIELDFKQNGTPWVVPFEGVESYNLIPLKPGYIADYDVTDAGKYVWNNAPAIGSSEREDFFTEYSIEGSKIMLACEGRPAGRTEVKLLVNATEEALSGIVSTTPMTPQEAQGSAWPTKMVEVRLMVDSLEGYEFPPQGGGGEGTVTMVNGVEPGVDGNVNVGALKWTDAGGGEHELKGEWIATTDDIPGATNGIELDTEGLVYKMTAASLQNVQLVPYKADLTALNEVTAQITSITSDYATKSWVEAKGYQTEGDISAHYVARSGASMTGNLSVISNTEEGYGTTVGVGEVKTYSGEVSGDMTEYALQFQQKDEGTLTSSAKVDGAGYVELQTKEEETNGLNTVSLDAATLTLKASRTDSDDSGDDFEAELALPKESGTLARAEDVPTQTAVLSGTYTDDTTFTLSVYVKNA